MSSRIELPVKPFDGDNWAEICAKAPSLSYTIVGERVDKVKDLSFIGGHRVRQYRFKKNVHFKIPEGIDLDISQVQASNLTPARRQPPQR